MSHAHTNLRRVPVQQRSADRLARILDAGAALLDEAGYELLSTRAVADRAGVPIGSVYRFFPNKRALVDALAERNLEVYAGRVVARLEGIPEREWRAAIDAVLDEYLAMKRSVPGFALVDFGPPVPTPGPLDEEANRRVAGRLTELLSGHLGRGRDGAPGDAALLRTVLVCVQAADALLQLAFRTDPVGDPDLIAETRTLLRAYLAGILD
ncbi:TetR/AcrR family transcriptional regulator [[Kitasatospora] papulosa]|uniref:Regulatory protein TetR n=1 Tax=Streptomyces pratensis (strain ATCC 33331 / IAF-45CD) TaxID=591167 RepID=A0A8D3WQ76_STRFA|nr:MULTISPECIES: TetR/AcrR family transcriptional regulator [Streptomyces]MYT53881.1 TetR family transcriptional regulator [Streptomyces sp. SID7815]MDX3184728.1 TetR/AcrR family transcriptional regulator [Streptomyces sp. ME02-7008A-1]MDX3304921.1 TetR/AcrR family transcriptional regulator [Streptomyces sp. ME02-7008A]WSK31301.1 TetR family transcriptional regulator [[Kitasatospora] papulosa]WSZ47134.1 TetR family transcriptional regulator [[Kitasatospora] papulosa]